MIFDKAHPAAVARRQRRHLDARGAGSCRQPVQDQLSIQLQAHSIEQASGKNKTSSDY
jgi:hypothetical protein